MTKFAGVAALATGILLGLPGSSRAGLTTILDQIGPNSSSLQSGIAFTDQVFGTPYNSDNIAVVDNFSITTPGTTITEVDAAVLGFNNFTGGDYAKITGVDVEIYSSVAAAASSLTGNIANISLSAADVTLTTNYTSDRYSALAQLAVNVTLGAGTYYLAVIPVLNFSNTGGAEIGVYSSTYAGDSNAEQVNPGGGFGYANNTNALGANAAYRILGEVPQAVPEPSSLIILATGLALASCRFLRVRAPRP